MKKETMIIGVVFLFVVIAAILVMPKNEKSPNLKLPLKDSGAILFYSASCPHCAIVDNYIKENRIEEKISFKRLRTDNNKDNYNLLEEKAAACGLDLRRIGVPFLWDNNECYIGDPQITKYFATKLLK